MRKLGWLVALGLIAGNAFAVPVTWEASGRLVFVRDAEALPLTPAFDDAFTFAITFDNEAPDTDIAEGYGFYENAIQSANFSIGGASYAIPLDVALSQFYIYAEAPINFYQLTFATFSGPTSQPYLTANLSWAATSPVVPTVDSIPSAPPADLSAYQATLNVVLFQNEAQLNGLEPPPFMQGRIDSVVARAVSVSEPVTLAVFALALLFVCSIRRWSSRT